MADDDVPDLGVIRVIRVEPEDTKAKMELEQFGQEQQLALQKSQAELARAQIENIGLRQDLDLRKGYAKGLFSLAGGWLGFVALLIILSGVEAIPFSLADSVLNGLIASATVDIVGLLAVVVRNLFPRRDGAG